MYIYILLTYVISSFHLVLAVVSIILGIISQSREVVWMAHSISPVWSGVFVSDETSVS
jgi:transmembrane protein 196